jgi:hypothetical protein
MATILEFRGGARSSAAGVPTSGADIIIFPGVRIERWETEPVKRKTATRKRRKRDHMEIKD